MCPSELSTICVHQQLDQEKVIYPTSTMTEVNSHSEFCDLIDPNLMGDVSSQGGYHASPQMPQYHPSMTEQFEPEPVHSFGSEVAHNTTGYSSAHWRHTSPLSNHNSPQFSYATSPSIGSDLNYDIATGPATPPDMAGSLFPLVDCPQDSPYMSHSTIRACQSIQTEDAVSVSDPGYFHIDMGVAETYPYSSAMSSPSLYSGSICINNSHIVTENGVDIQPYTPMPSPYYEPIPRMIGIKRQASGEQKVSAAQNILLGHLNATSAARQVRSPQGSTNTIIGKRASPDHLDSLPNEKRRKMAAPSPKSCSKCKTHFADRETLEEHIRAEHPRPYICVFHYAGCTSRFDAKNEWKRHVTTKHLGLKYWLCTEGACSQARGPSTHRRAPSLPECGSIFNRKDLYTQHVRRMHPDATCRETMDQKKAKADSDDRLKKMQEEALRVRCELPTFMPCPVAHCRMEFNGPTAWDDRMEHVAQQHFENAAAGREPPVEFGGPNDIALTSWAQQENVQIVKQTAAGWELCDPLKGNGGLKRSNTESSEEDAEGEDQF